MGRESGSRRELFEKFSEFNAREIATFDAETNGLDPVAFETDTFKCNRI